MRRGVLAVLLIVHGLLHASIGVWEMSGRWSPAVSLLWSLAIVGYVASGAALLRLPGVRRYWKGLLGTATFASALLLMLFGGVIGLIGVPVSLVLGFVALHEMCPVVDRDVDEAERLHVTGLPHPAMHRAGWTLAALAVVYVAAVVAFRPVYLSWGTTPAERTSPLPGDVRTVDARYRVDHGITINAPADSVWPWLVQIGQDRAGFYSYTKLERLFGARITNADRIHREWQDLSIGDTVRATQPDYFGGRFGTLGWKVSDVVPGRALVLENWGSFVLVPVDSATTRLIIRTRGEGKPTLPGLLFGPLNVFVFEPAHFIMQRGMLRGVRERAERPGRGTA